MRKRRYGSPHCPPSGAIASRRCEGDWDAYIAKQFDPAFVACDATRAPFNRLVQIGVVDVVPKKPTVLLSQYCSYQSRPSFGRLYILNKVAGGLPIYRQRSAVRIKCKRSATPVLRQNIYR